MRAEPKARGVAHGGSRTPYLGLDFDRLALAEMLAWLRARDAGAPFAYVITPNVDHMVRLERLGGDLRRAYDEADICLCDSRILARLARLSGITLPIVPGSDLTAAAIEQVLDPGDTLCLIGGKADHAARLGELFPHVDVVQHIAPMGLLHDPLTRSAAVAAAAATGARLTLIAVGSPQQELLALEMRKERPGARHRLVRRRKHRFPRRRRTTRAAAGAARGLRMGVAARRQPAPARAALPDRRAAHLPDGVAVEQAAQGLNGQAAHDTPAARRDRRDMGHG